MGEGVGVCVEVGVGVGVGVDVAVGVGVGVPVAVGVGVGVLVGVGVGVAGTNTLVAVNLIRLIARYVVALEEPPATGCMIEPNAKANSEYNGCVGEANANEYTTFVPLRVCPSRESISVHVSASSLRANSFHDLGLRVAPPGVPNE